MLTNEQIAQAQLDAYNMQNLDAHLAFFAEDMTIANLREAPNLSGIAAYKERMAGVFAQFPQNKVELLGRTIIGNKVLDHEKVMRSPDAVAFEVIAVYTIENGKIASVDFIK
jgi:hypothetical protein